MLDDKQSSIVRPKAVPPMFTPVLTQNSQSSSIMHSTNRLSQQALTEIGTMIRKHDRDATRLYDCIGQVKVFSYNSNELRWENSPNIEGNLCVYEKQQTINNRICPSYAFAIISGEKYLIQAITSDMVQHADKLRLFYEVARNDRREVFCLHFLTESECLRLSTFLGRCIQAIRTIEEQQQQQQQQQQARIIPSSVPIDTQTQLNGQIPSTMSVQQTPTNVYRQQIPQQPIILQNPTTSQFGSSRVNINQTPTRLTASSNIAVQQQQQQQQSNSYPPQIPIDLIHTNLRRVTPTVPSTSLGQIEVPKTIEQTPFPPSPVPLTNGNNNNNNNNNNNSTEDPTSSLKRLLNIRGQNALENLSLDDSSVFTKQQTQQNLLDLMPPSAFEPIAATPPSPVVAIGAERTKHRLSTQLAPTMSREHFRNVLIHLVQNDDHFLDIIYQACLTHPPTSQ
ncbi:unnamed protein product [Rotaria sp. Silwood2]|nr:unnamed protein product [Rotaria sp. Silwood2]CAF3384720.1 unnamed protein product [Rotaria sp. Silwood2]CAF4525927.1 unnamed protein product [Rotaria sp. Silwood2]CAF4638044.1 unnamed protein product [Rotaria sp. Silwood2]